ncbi:MAG TPA: ABC transporter substrate-binding protein [Stellaceae bacterium]|nr:ABC transporter substrate-binding protein [Stellaceae bacterium]
MPRWLWLPMLLGILVGAPPAAGEKRYGPGVTDAEIKIGQTMPYSGPASAYGAIGKAEAAYFAMLNEQGGINGRKIKFLTLDDGYSPPKTVEQIRKLVEQEEVLLLFQTMGTATNNAIHKYVNDKKVPHLFLATGASLWADPEHFPWTMGWQPDLQTEGAIFAKDVLTAKPRARIGVLYQNDDYGKDYLRGFRDGLAGDADKMIVATASYETTDANVDSQIVTLQASDADVLFNVSSPKFAAQAIRKAYNIGWKPRQYLTSGSSSVAAVLQPAGLEKSIGIVSAGYIKDPTDVQWQSEQSYKDWLAWMKRYNPDADVADRFNVYGYSAAQTLEIVLRQCGDDLTRANVMRQAANLRDVQLPMMLPGILINTNPTNFRPIRHMQLQRFDGTRWVLFGGIVGG